MESTRSSRLIDTAICMRFRAHMMVALTRANSISSAMAPAITRALLFSPNVRCKRE